MSHYNRYSDAAREGRQRGEGAYSDFDYDRDKYDKYGTEQQRDYTGAFDQAREDKRYEQRRQEEREEEERIEQRQAERRAQERYEQECYEQQMYEQQQCEDEQAQT